MLEEVNSKCMYNDSSDDHASSYVESNDETTSSDYGIHSDHRSDEGSAYSKISVLSSVASFDPDFFRETNNPPPIFEEEQH